MQRTPTVRRTAAILVLAVVGSLLFLPRPADGAGVTTHGWMAVDAIDLVPDADLQAILDGHREQVRAGAMFPDAGYVGTNTFGEEAHWQRFVDAYIDQIRARPDCPDLRDPDGPCADMIAHVMGVAGHGMGDEVWDWLFEPYGPDLDEYWTHPEVPVANEGGAETQMDIVAIGDYGAPRPSIPPLPSSDTLLAAFEAAGLSGVTANQFDLAGLGELVWDVERGWADRFLDDIRTAMPWMSANMVTAPGGVEFASVAIAGYWTSLWGRILGDQPRTSVSATYPAAGQVDVPATGWERTFQPGSARGRGGARNRITAALSYSRPYRPGTGGPPVPQEIPPATMTLTERSTGAPVPIMPGYPRSVPYTADPGEHLIDVQPANDLEPCTWYDVAVSLVEPLADGTGRPVLPHVWSFRTDDGAGNACPATTSALTGAVAGPDGLPVAGVLVMALVPGEPGFGAFTTTRTDGTYVLGGLEPGSYEVLFHPPAGSGLADEWSGDVVERAQATPVPVPTGAPVDAQLAAAPRVSGVVLDPSGAAVAGAEVLAFRHGPTWLPAATATTAGDGSYVLPDLQPGTYQLLVRPPAGSGLQGGWYGSGADRATATAIDAAPSTSTTADVTLVHSAFVNGVVSGPSGGVEGVRVSFFDADDRWVGSVEAETDATGAYQVEAPPGTYRVRFTPPETSGLGATWLGGAALRSASTPVDLVGATTTDVSIALAPT